MTGNYFAELRGDVPSVYADGVDHYYTNYGAIHTISCTGKVISACIGFTDHTMDGGNKHFTIRINNGSYSIRTGTLYKEYNEFASPNFPHKIPYAGKVSLATVFEMMSHIPRLSRASISVVLTLRQLLENKLTGADRKAMENLLDLIARNYSKDIPRQPILTRVPIKATDYVQKAG